MTKRIENTVLLRIAIGAILAALVLGGMALGWIEVPKP